MKIIKLLLITNLLFLPFNSYADPFDAFKEIAKELDKSVNQKKEETPKQETPKQETKKQETPQQETLKKVEQKSEENVSSKKDTLTSQKHLDLLLQMSAMAYYYSRMYAWGKPQWDFNVKYGAPQVSSNYTKMVKQEIPQLYKTLGQCSKKLGGSDLNESIVQKYYQTTDNESIAQMREMLAMFGGESALETAPVRVPKTRKDLDAAAESEQTLRMLGLDLIYKAFGIKTDKNWCETFRNSAL